jgi:hypothetical protein
MPCTSIAEIISAAIGVKGMPSASSRTSDAVAAELFAASGPATPSIAHPFGEVRYPKGEAGLAGDGLLTDGAEHQPERHRQQRRGERAAGDPRHHHQAARGQREKFRRSEQDRDIGEQRGEQHHADHGELTRAPE